MRFDAAGFLADLFKLTARPCPDDLTGDWRFAYEERAGIMEFDGNLPRREAERRALAEVVASMRCLGHCRRQINLRLNLM